LHRPHELPRGRGARRRRRLRRVRDPARALRGRRRAGRPPDVLAPAAERPPAPPAAAGLRSRGAAAGPRRAARVPRRALGLCGAPQGRGAPAARHRAAARGLRSRRERLAGARRPADGAHRGLTSRAAGVARPRSSTQIDSTGTPVKVPRLIAGADAVPRRHGSHGAAPPRSPATPAVPATLRPLRTPHAWVICSRDGGGHGQYADARCWNWNRDSRRLARSLDPARGRDYIAAIATFYTDADKVDHKTRAVAYEKAMEALAQKYPSDLEASIFYALALNTTLNPSDKTYANQLKAAGILEKVFAVQPEHPGVAHYLIHSYDFPPIAQKGLPAARRYASIAPSAPHAQHMPSHIFTRLGYWQDS